MAIALDASDPLVVFAALAGLIFIGFLGNLIFARLRFNDTLILIAIGVLLGPVLLVLDPAKFASVSAIVGPLALILILFDGGLALKLREIRQGLSGAALMGLVSFVLSAGLAGAVAAYALVDAPGLGTKERLLTGMILGSILGGTSALVVMPSLRNVKCEQKTSTMLGLESALTDILVVVVTFTLMNVVAQADAPAIDGNETTLALDPQGITSTLVITFAMSLFFGTAAGLLWIVMLPRVRDKPYGYMLTLGAMFGLYVLVEWILQDVSSGGGPLAVLAFGIVLGNHMSLGKLGQRIGEDFGPGIKRFQGEISFLVRTFFFLYLGVLVDLRLLGDLHVWAVGIVIFSVLAAARYVAVVAVRRRVRLRGDDWILLTMMPRGLAAAVLAALPASQYGIPGTERFVAMAFLILVLTNLTSTVGAMVLEKTQGRDPKPEAAPGLADRKRAARR